MKRDRTLYWIFTGLMCLAFTGSALMYIFKNDMPSAVFPALGFPTWLIYPLAAAKILGVIAVLTRKSKLLKEWAYAGFFFDAILAASAHFMAQDGEWPAAAVVATVVLLSRFFESRAKIWEPAA